MYSEIVMIVFKEKYLEILSLVTFKVVNYLKTFNKEMSITSMLKIQ